MSVKEKILVIGGGGYAGSRLVPVLLKNYKVKVLDTFWYGQESLKKFQCSPDLEIIVGDMRNQEIVNEALDGIDIVIHLACISNDPSFDLDPALGKSINLDSFEPLVKKARNAGVQRFVYASSSSVYGIKSEEKVTEDLILEPLTDYSRFKAECERILLSNTTNDFVGTILRPATLCGFSERQRFDLVVNILTNQAINEGKIRIYGGEQFRPNLHVDDMAEAYINVISQPVEKVKNEIFNVGGKNLTINQIAETISDVTGVSKFEYHMTNDPRSYRVDSTKIEKSLNYKPKRDIKSAIEDLFKAFQLGIFYRPLDNPLYFNITRMQEFAVK